MFTRILNYQNNETRVVKNTHDVIIMTMTIMMIIKLLYSCLFGKKSKHYDFLGHCALLLDSLHYSWARYTSVGHVTNLLDMLNFWWTCYTPAGHVLWTCYAFLGHSTILLDVLQLCRRSYTLDTLHVSWTR